MNRQDIEGDNNTQSAIVAGMLMGEPHHIGDGFMGVLVPAGAKLEQIDLRAIEDRYADHPRRKKGTRSLATAASFIAYVSAHKLPSTSIYAKKDNTTFSAVFNDHEPEPRERTITDMSSDAVRAEAPPEAAAQAEKLEDASQQAMPDLRVHIVRVEHDAWGLPGHGDFTATYACPVSVEWKRWMGNSQHAADGKQAMTQANFMQFLEDNLLDITTPKSGLLLQSVRSFEAKKDVSFKSATRLEDGSIAFNYIESVNEVPQDGKLSLPSQFTITIPVFDGGQKYELDARLRYRVSGGGLQLWYELVNPHKVLEHAFNTVLEQIKEGNPDVPVYSV